jgi:hypothetical protein
MSDALEKDYKLHSLSFDAKNYSLPVGGEAYPHQLEQMATGLYGEHDEWFGRTLGFTKREALHVVQVAMELSAWRRYQVLSNVDDASEDPSRQTEALAQYALSDSERVPRQQRRKISASVRAARNGSICFYCSMRSGRLQSDPLETIGTGAGSAFSG